MRLFVIAIILFGHFNQDVFIPIDAFDRNSINSIELTEIGEFGLLRKARPKVPAHFHAGIDIKRPSPNYNNEVIYPVTNGIVISIRRDGPYAQIIIEHEGNNKFWTVYEHVAGINVNLFDEVAPDEPIARFMNKSELDRFGWQFDHVHFEVLKQKPVRLKPDNSNPERLFASYSLVCYTKEDLDNYFYNPLKFLEEQLAY